jgi:hypothetical protein
MAAAALFVTVATAFAQVNVVRDGKASAVVVTAVKPSPVAAYAAEELVNHVEKATGQRLAVVTEAEIPDGYESRIFVGMTDAAAKQGIDASQLDIEQSVLRTVGSDLYIIGKEITPEEYKGTRAHAEPWNPLSTECEYSGTLYGVYDVLERYVGVRWLWPGELGTFVPHAADLTVPALNETNKPKLQYRDMGDWSLVQCGITGIKYGAEVPYDLHWTPLTEELIRALVFPTEEAGHEYGKAMWTYTRRHRRFTPIEHPTVILGTHTIAGLDDWWAKYGKEHPEWFAMRADGQRGLKTPRSGPYTPMCVSNPELHQAIIAEWDGGDVLTLGEVDAGGDSFCQCDNCKAWDDPQPTDFPPIMGNYKYLPRAVGARYARYWKAIYDLAVKRNPNVRISGYLYHNTLPAPTRKVELNKNIYGEFVIYGGYDGWYPMSDVEDQWYRDNWKAWADTGMSLIYGPNCLLSNYVTPNLTTWQAGEFIRYAYQHGMVGANLRSFTFSWSAHGPMAYMYYKLLEDPELKIADIRQEYFSAFGPAAKQVEAYFDYWENYAKSRPVIGTPENGDEYGAIEKLRRARGHYLAYPPAVFVPAEEMLANALATAQQDPLPEYAQRVEFLQAGLKHARLALKIHDFIDYDSPMAQLGAAPVDNPEKLAQARAAMKELMRFRHDPKNLFVSDYISNALTEQAYIRNIEALIEGQDKSGDYVKQDEIY